MKYIFIILICFLSLTVHSQVIQNRANASVTVQDARWKSLLNLYIPLYADTTAANLQKGIDTTAALIYTYNNNSLWYRSVQKKWVLVGTGGSGSGQLFAVGDSTATGTRYFNQKNNAFIYDSAGSHVIVAYDTFNHYFTKFYLDTTYTYLQVSSNDFNTFGSISVTKGNATMSASSPDSGHQVVVNNGNVTVRDLRNYPSKLVITGISTGTDTVFAPTQILVLQGDTVKSARYPSLSPTDTANLSYRIDTVGKIIYIDTTQYLRFNLTDSILYSIPVNGVFANGLISTGGINLLDSTITILPNIVFVRNDTTYTLTSSASFIINSTATGYYRTDLIYIDSNNIVQHLVGIQDTVITVPPSVPYKGIGVAIVNVHNSVITSTVIPTNNNWVTDGTNSFPLGTDGILGTSTASNLRTVIGGVNRSIYPATGGFALYGIGTTQMNAIPTPLAGTIVYNNDSLAYCYYNGSAWLKFGSGGSGGTTYTAGNGLSLYGTQFKITDSSSGAGTKIMWIPSKKAFRVGSITGVQWNIDSIGTNSFAAGLDLVVTGSSSAAFGNTNSVRGGQSFTSGNSNIISGNNSGAIGQANTVTNSQSFAGGGSNKLYASGSFAGGTANTVYLGAGSGSAAIGNGSFIYAIGSVATGNNLYGKSFNGSVAGSFNDTSDVPSKTAYNDYNRAFVVGTGQSNVLRRNGMEILFKGLTRLNQYGTGTLFTVTDTIANKIAVIDDSGYIRKMSYWPTGGETITHAVDSIYTLTDSLLLVHTSPYNRTDTFSWRGSGGSSNSVDTIYRTLGTDSIKFTIGGRYHAIKDSTGNVYTASSGLVLQGNNFKIQDTLNGAGTKLMWIPSKAAFRAGSVSSTQWDIDSIGTGSISMGRNGKATNNDAIALGTGSQATANQATAIQGGKALAGATIAIGSATVASATNAVAIGVFDTCYAQSGAVLGFTLVGKSTNGAVLGVSNDTATASSTTLLKRAFQVGTGQSGSDNRRNAITTLFNGNTGLGVNNPTAVIHLKPGTLDSNTAPLKFEYRSVSTSATSGTGTIATITFPNYGEIPFSIGTKIIVSGVTPAGYNGTFTVTAASYTSVSFLSSATGVQTVAGTITQGQLMTTPEAGAMEYIGTRPYFTGADGVRGYIPLTFTGTAAPATTPSVVGDHFVDTTNKKEYVATGTSSSADWTILN